MSYTNRIMRQFTCFILITLFCLSMTACSLSCAYSARSDPKQAKVVMQGWTQFVDKGMQADKEYVVREKVDLNGKQVFVPAGVTITLKNGGAIVNGTLCGNDTKLNSRTDGVLGVRLKGTWCVEKVKDVLFSRDFLSDAEIIANINTIQSDSVQNEIIVTRDYTIPISESGGFGLNLKSNTNLLLYDTLTLAANDYKSYSIINIKGKENVAIKGGKIVGDVGQHTYLKGSSSEWGMGITINESSNVIVEDVFITRCTGDGIYISGGNEPSVGIYDHASKNVSISNVICDANRRQGLSIIHVDGLTVRDCSFVNTGQVEFTAPGAGIDVEPNVSNGKNMSVRNLLVDNCFIYGNKGPAVSCSSTYEEEGRQNYENLMFSNCFTDGPLRAQSTDLAFCGCTFKEVRFAAIYSPTHIKMDRCTILGGYGIIVYAPTETGVFYKDKLLAIDMKNCTISVSEGETRTKSLISCHKNYVPNVEYINLENCRLLIPKSKDKAFKLTEYDMKDKLRISSSEILMEDRDLDTTGIYLRDNLIRCRNVVGGGTS